MFTQNPMIRIAVPKNVFNMADSDSRLDALFLTNQSKRFAVIYLTIY